MGNSCSCDIDDYKKEQLVTEFHEEPIQSTLVGYSSVEELFISSNINLHNKDFTFSLLKIKPGTRSKSSTCLSRKSKNQSSHQFPLFKSIQDNSKAEDDDDGIILEGELLKYRPGISQNHTPRWCRLTGEGFAYYKTQWTATCNNKSPLAFIPLIQIKEVNEINRPETGKGKIFEFEIFLYQEDELTKMSRSTNGFTLKKNTQAHNGVPASWWSVRQIEWYSAERRLLFGHRDCKTIQQWVDAIQSTVEGFCMH
ncbi:hypothetical protein SteCoe_17544 [Stentor coeruleus]|uniref:PH domain-containing protein n=1 Tax=Stentor coeruleus TaxID=5963 RepID=A0A1R2BYM7_9CILI|nr:hypothetical protein SteCoe_17544 [Stentor coeruleus]